MASAKDIQLRPIDAKTANALVKRVHYSGKVVNNSQLHIGVFLNRKLEGAMQFGPSLDKRKMLGLVSGTGWNEFLELNRMAFSDALARNSESRAIGIAMKLIKKHAPHVKWIVSFADGTQCGDGTIYRASGFVLTGIKKNNQIWEMPNGEVATRMVATDTRRPERTRLLNECGQNKPRRLSRVTATKAGSILETGGASMKPFIEAGARPMVGFQLRYLYFIDPTARERLTVPILPFSEIEKRGAGMYKGQTRATSIDSDASAIHAGESGANPTVAL